MKHRVNRVDRPLQNENRAMGAGHLIVRPADCHHGILSFRSGHPPSHRDHLSTRGDGRRRSDDPAPHWSGAVRCGSFHAVGHSGGHHAPTRRHDARAAGDRPRSALASHANPANEKDVLPNARPEVCGVCHHWVDENLNGLPMMGDSTTVALNDLLAVHYCGVVVRRRALGHSTQHQ